MTQLDFEDRNQFGSFNGSCMSILLKAMKLELIDNNDNMKVIIKIITIIALNIELKFYYNNNNY